MTIAKAPRITAIGSLPHHNIDAALEFSFRFGIPFLPQIPLRNPWEYMLAQALEGLPGLRADRDGSVTLDTEIWKSRSHEFTRKLEAAFGSREPGAFEEFEPSQAVSSSWQPFVWELRERKAPVAKIQIAGPMTAQWALKLVDHAGHSISALEFGDRHPELATQIFRLVLARAMAMSRRLIAQGTQPLLFLDEPGLYGLTLSNPRHLLAFQELKVLVQTLRKTGVQVGLHCCSNTDWSAVLSLPLHFLSIDTALSLESLLQKRPELERFVAEGGRLSLGVISTGTNDPAKWNASKLAESIHKVLPEKVIADALFTPACGLAYMSAEGAESVLETLNQFEVYASRN